MTNGTKRPRMPINAACERGARVRAKPALRLLSYASKHSNNDSQPQKVEKEEQERRGVLTEQRKTRGRPRTGSCSGLLPSRSPSDFQYLCSKSRRECAVAYEGGAGAARAAKHRVANGAGARRGTQRHALLRLLLASQLWPVISAAGSNSAADNGAAHSHWPCLRGNGAGTGGGERHSSSQGSNGEHDCVTVRARCSPCESRSVFVRVVVDCRVARRLDVWQEPALSA